MSADMPATKIGPRPGTLVCKGCPAYEAEPWREPSGDGETFDNGQYAWCGAADRKSMGPYHYDHSSSPEWCPALSPSSGEGGDERVLTAGERHELECLRARVRQIDYPCSPHCDGYLRELALRNTAAPVSPALAEEVARAICLTTGSDPDEDAPLGMICGPNNEPLPWWRYYEEQAEAAIPVVLKAFQGVGAGEWTDETLRDRIRSECSATSVAKWAREHGLHDELVGLFLRGKRPAEPKLLAALGLTRSPRYVAKERRS